jgi:hypothetical protein
MLIMGGQSNMVGTQPTNSPEILVDERTNQIHRYWYQVNNLTNSDVSLRLSDTTATSNRWGFEMTMLDGIYTNQHRKLAVVKVAQGSTSLDGSWMPGQTRYGQWTNLILQAKAKLIGEGYTVKIVGCVWCQGEDDSLDDTKTANYESNLTNMLAQLMVDVGAETNTWTWVVPLSINYGNTNAAIIRAAQYNIASNRPSTRTVYVDDQVFGSGPHYDEAGYITIGYRLAADYVSLIPATPWPIALSNLTVFIDY